MHALIDSDIFCYEFGACTDAEYKPLSWPLVQSRIQGRLSGILEAVDASSYQLYLTSTDKSNFRIERATVRPYKGHRETEKPYWYKRIREFLIAHRRAEDVSGWEADDQLSIEQCLNTQVCVQQALEGCTFTETVICSRDKDLNMVPGWHYSWGAGNQKEKPLWNVSELDGLRSFYCQCLTGDPTDNILGLYGVGGSSKLLQHVKDCQSEVEMYQKVKEAYEKRFGSYWRLFLEENGALLWMLRTPNINEWKERMDSLDK